MRRNISIESESNKTPPIIFDLDPKKKAFDLVREAKES
jgi:hypothetical protein